MEGISQLLLLVAAIIVATTVGTTIIGISFTGSDIIKSQGNNVVEDISSDITIVNDLSNSEFTYDSSSDKITLFLKNTGSKEINLNSIIVLVNGDPTSLNSTKIISGNSNNIWEEGEVVEVETQQVSLSNEIVSIKAQSSSASDKIEIYIS